MKHCTTTQYKNDEKQWNINAAVPVLILSKLITVTNIHWLIHLVGSGLKVLPLISYRGITLVNTNADSGTSTPTRWQASAIYPPELHASTGPTSSQRGHPLPTYLPHEYHTATSMMPSLVSCTDKLSLIAGVQWSHLSMSVHAHVPPSWRFLLWHKLPVIEYVVGAYAFTTNFQ